MPMSDEARRTREDIHKEVMENEEFMARAREAQKAAKEEVKNDR